MNKPTQDALLHAIRAKCRDCCGGSLSEVKRCSMRTECPLWPYRTAEKNAVKVKGQVSIFDTIYKVEVN